MHRKIYAHIWMALYIDWLLIASAGRAIWDRVPTECGHIGR